MQKLLKKEFGLLILGLVLLMGGTSSFSQSLVGAGQTDVILELAKGYGSAYLDTSKDGDPIIRGKLEGRSYSVHFYGCKSSAGCGSIQFFWGVNQKNISQSKINDWNRTKRFGRAYIDSDGDIAIEMDVNLRHGVSRKNLDDTFDYWKTVVTEFYKTFVN